MLIQDESHKVLFGEQLGDNYAINHTTLLSNKIEGTCNIDPTTLFTNRPRGGGYASSGSRSGGGVGSSGASSSMSRRPSPYCEICDLRGHTKEACFKAMQSNHCNMKGHTTDNCYKLIGYPADFKG
ncbi:hypothetical protein KY290_033676 [Solanum tuberosum]|uniref:Transcription factor interactor and regulator CCHC(Zn) family n=1 Tax=Solanum tuberosum TaxID=4113 RepID=A0ABQ7U2E3_SOLTU|nr:hypothetical protein KY285_032938 [Solanum tuberosum]KAH0740633.1 hypothetical protein KY290_033676 [Solanum tuberosum]